MSFDPIANGWRKLLKRSEKVVSVAEITLHPDVETAYTNMISGKIPFVAGKKYTVSVTSADDEVNRIFPPTECVCVDMSEGMGLALCLGNQALFDETESENTGEWFMIMTVCDEGEWVTMALHGFGNGILYDGTIPVTVTTTETIQTIDPKYLPVVKFTTPCPADYSTSVALTAEESAQLEAYAKAHLPVVVDVELEALDGMRASLMCTLMYYEGAEHIEYIYGTTIGEVGITFGTDGSGTWVFAD